MKTKVLTSLFAAAILSSFQVHALDSTAGEKTYKNVCKNCHGPTAKGMASFPKLAGNTAEYLTMRLEQYRAREKLGANSPLMWPLVAELSDEDIANLASYISTSFK